MRTLLSLCTGLVLFYTSSVLAVPLSAAPISGLNFGILVPGDSGATIPPGTSESPQNASVQVNGDPNTAYTIIFPQSSITLTTGAAGLTERFDASSFLSFPAAGSNGLLNGFGQQIIYIGASRDALLPNQSPGPYSGTFDITVAN
jgi:hypothetical protein